jgi:3D (Asp-Asp-Asp) domain-containing protein
MLAGLGLGVLLAGGAATGAAATGVALAPAAAALAAMIDTARKVPLRREAPEPVVLGRFQLTYYWMASEATHPATADGAEASPDDVVLQSRHCTPIARVSPSFARSLRLEGTGVLRDGRVINVAGNCECGKPCYRIARRSHRFGTGVAERPLSPFRSVAVDPKLVAIGSALYIPELDGKTMPGRAPWGGFVHDGCVTADDRGGGVRGKQLDLFTVRRNHYKALSRRLRLDHVTVVDGRERCAAGAARRTVAARRGGV